MISEHPFWYRVAIGPSSYTVKPDDEPFIISMPCRLHTMQPNNNAKLFELSAKRGYASEAFVKAYMASETAEAMDMEFNHVHWAGKEYIMSRVEEECGNKLHKDGPILDNETLYWRGYIYRYWNLYSKESSRGCLPPEPD